MRSILLLLLTLTSSPVIAVVVIGEGATLIDAQDQARRQAITQVVGAIVDTERVVANRKLVVDQILTYSAGYIVKEVILEQYPIGERFFVKLDVEVKSSKLKDFVLSQTEGTSEFDGDNVKLQIESYNNQLISADTLIDNTLKYHPSHAYNIEIVDYNISIDASRKAFLTVKYQQSWNHEFVDAIEELANLIDVPHYTNGYLKFGDRKYKINDHILMNKFRDTFGGGLRVIITINSMHNDALINRCVAFNSTNQRLGELYWVRGRTTDIEFDKNKIRIQQIKLELNLEDIEFFQDESQINIRLTKNCPKYKRK